VYGRARSLSPSVFLMHQVSGICLLFFGKKNFSKIFTQDPNLVMCLQILHNFVYFLENMQLFFWFFEEGAKGGLL
jgi:hypothetical protein